MEIRIRLEVQNPEQVLKAHKGGLMGFFAGVVMTKETKKKRIEKAVCEQIVASLEEELPKRLEEECVKADVKIEIVEKRIGPEMLNEPSDGLEPEN